MNPFGPQTGYASIDLPAGSASVRYAADRTWVKDATSLTSRDGTILDAAFFNNIIGNLTEVVDAAGLLATSQRGDMTILVQAIRALVLEYAGSANGLPNTVVSNISSAIAAVQAAVAKAQADISSVSNVITSISSGSQASIAQALAAITANQQAVDDAQAKANSAVAQLSAIATTVSALQSSVASNTAAIVVQEGALTTQNEALSGQITSVQAEFDGNLATLQNSYVDLSNSTSALSASLTALQATVDGNTATISQNAITFDNAVQAVAATVTSLQSDFEMSSANVTAQFATVVSMQSAAATALTALQATVDGNTATISQNAVVAENATSAVAAEIDSVSTQVANNTASVSQVSTSLNGVLAQYVLAVNVDGTTGNVSLLGTKQANGSVTTKLDIDVGSVDIHGDVVIDGTVSTSKLVASSGRYTLNGNQGVSPYTTTIANLESAPLSANIGSINGSGGLTVALSGSYVLTGQVEFYGSLTDAYYGTGGEDYIFFVVAVDINGSQTAYVTGQIFAFQNFQTSLECPSTLALNAGDVVTVTGYAANGVNGSPYSTNMNVEFSNAILAITRTGL